MNWPLLQNSLLVAGTTTALAVGFGLVAALWLATLAARWRNMFLALAVLALALPPFLVTNCWLALLGDTGVLRAWLPFRIYSPGGSIWILSLLLWPISLFTVLSAWRRLEPAQFDCEPAMTDLALLRWLLLPVARGELALAAVVTFVLALNNFAVPAILQTKVLPDEMWVRFNTQFDTLGALKLSTPLVFAPLILLAWASRRAVSWPRIQGTVSANIFRRQLGPTWQIGCGAIASLLCVLSVGLPLAQITFANRTWAELPGAVEAGTGAIWNSFWFAALAATTVVVVGLAFCLRSRRREETQASQPAIGERQSPIRPSLLASIAAVTRWLPFFIPGVLIGIALIKIFNRPVLVAFYQSAGIVILAFVIRFFAPGWTAARHAVGSVDPVLTDAAKVEGATGWQMLRHVIGPQIAPQIAAAWYVVYLLCLWDVESMILVVPPGGETLALRIFNLLHYGHNAQVNALCLMLLAVAVAPLVGWVAWWTTSNTQHPTSNIQRNTKHQTRSSRVWSLRFLWCLVFGVWCFCPGCSPQTTKNEEALTSRFFERAEVIGSRGVGLGEFNKPRSVAVDAQDNVYAVDMTGRVQKFSPDGRFLLSWQMPETTLGKPKGMGRDREGNIIVIEPHYQRVNQFSPDGKLVAQWGCRGTNAGCFTLPRAVAVNSRGEFLVSEYTTEERVQIFRSRVEGRESRAGFVGSIGRAGTGAGEFNRPEGICVDAQDRLYVADSCNHRIQIFSADGKFIRQYGRAGTGRGELSYPYDIAVDAGGNQFVCEFGNSRIQVFDANGQPIEIIGGPGAAPGRFANPWGVALDSQGNLYVADSQNHRVQKLIRRKGPIGPRTASYAPRTTHHASQ
jgi:ABC-type Fe3+ transport system permease subunit/DNA-binding beta-propeller fold protein YncE